MKKLVSILLCVAMLCAVCVTAFAEGEPTTSAVVSVGTAEGAKGEKVSLPLSVKDNSGMASLTAVISYDAAVLSITDDDITPAGILDGAVDTADSTKVIYQVNTAEAGKVYISFIKSENVTGDGILFNVAFTIKTNAAAGDSEVTLVVDEMANADAAIYTGYTAENGAVKVGESTLMYGDVNNDGKVNSEDALMVLQSVVGIVTLDERAAKVANVNSDNKIDTQDALGILQYIVNIRSELPYKD